MKSKSNRSAERVYVKVNSDFDVTGYMQPRSITWDDGRTFPVETVNDFRPASAVESSLSGDCYTIIIRGGEKLLFFERTDPLFAGRFGRWYVMRPSGQ